VFARMLSILIATWILVAAFAFSPPPPLFVCMIVVGLISIGAEVLAMYRSRLRFIDTVLALFLTFSGFLLSTGGSDLLLWNNFFSGVALFVLSMIPARIKRGPWMPGGEIRTHHHAEAR